MLLAPDYTLPNRVTVRRMDETLIRAATLTGYSQAAQRAGLDAMQLLREVGLDPSVLITPEQHIPAAKVSALLELSAQRSADPAFGLRLAAARASFDFGLLGALLAHNRTLREALMAAVQYRHLLNDAVGLYMEISGDLAIIREEVIDTDTHRQSTEMAAGIVTRMCRGLLGPDWKPSHVYFTHAAPDDTRFHRHFFGCPVSFDSEFNGVVCTVADLDRPNPNADPELVQYAESLAQPLNANHPNSLALEVRNAIYRCLPLGTATIEEVSSHFHTTPRTLRRRLVACDTDFSRLLDDVRINLAMRYLGNAKHPIGRVSSLLGFARQTSFTRWFIAHFGMPPREWRDKAHSSS